MYCAVGRLLSQKFSVLTEIYIEALLVDDELADQVWEMWEAGLILDELAAYAWWLFVEQLTVWPGKYE